MKEEENVYEETTLAEETTAVSTGGEDRKEAAQQASTVLGKFKDVDALARAYGSLQAEFTRRSQRLKELEKMAENFEKGEKNAACSGAEKLRKNAKARKEETKQFDEFMAKTVEVSAQETKENEPISKPEVLENKPSLGNSSEAVIEKNGTTMYEVNAAAAALNDKDKEEEKKPLTSGQEVGEWKKSIVESESEAELSETLYQKASRDEKVRLKIIGEYLSSLGRSGAPLMAGGAGMLATPPIKPKSISDAGTMALLYFKKPTA